MKKYPISLFFFFVTNIITKTRLYNTDPLKPTLKNINCGYSLEPLPEAVLTSTHNLCFEQKYKRYQSFLSKNFQFLEVKFSIYLNRRVFVMTRNAHYHTCQIPSQRSICAYTTMMLYDQDLISNTVFSHLCLYEVGSLPMWENSMSNDHIG